MDTPCESDIKNRFINQLHIWFIMIHDVKPLKGWTLLILSIFSNQDGRLFKVYVLLKAVKGNKYLNNHIPSRLQTWNLVSYYIEDERYLY